MTSTWADEPELKPDPIGILGWLRVILRGVPLVFVLALGLCFHSIVRLIERPFFGEHRPLTQRITQVVCRIALLILGLNIRFHGKAMEHPGAVVANHSSWLDIFVLNARKRIYFVAKSEVKSWAGIGRLARATGTVFIKRDRRDAQKHIQVFKGRLKLGHRLLFFPEGTSSDGQRVLSFKTTLFAPFLTEELRQNAFIQPISVIYHSPTGKDPRYYGWWGDMDFGPHVLQVLGARWNGSVDVVYSPALDMRNWSDRKKLAFELESTVRREFTRFREMS
ncbi:MAG: lysophospholipid acyltransferase family protein [Paracoccaceae bacterium]|nr:lysophospholipid acyltransferase family protein [Paracoccaceae bacterium]MDG2260403.1 lysophospholipid acyltransferase family protein [Paracoccaceae bacterium]